MDLKARLGATRVDGPIRSAQADGQGPKLAAKASQALTCSSCGRPMWQSRTSLPQGEATCLPCRRARRPAKPAPFVPTDRMCKTCALPFEAMRHNQVYCSPACRPHGTGPKTSASARGYGAAHQRARRKWRVIVEIGEAVCSLCGDPIEPGSRWDLDHTPGKQDYRGPAHQSCNRSEGASRGNRQRGRQTP